MPMSLKVRFRFDGKCSFHPRFNPARDGRPEHSKCEGCESLYVIYLYIKIGSHREKPRTRTVSWLHFQAAARNAGQMSPQRCPKANPTDPGQNSAGGPRFSSQNSTFKRGES